MDKIIKRDVEKGFFRSLPKPETFNAQDNTMEVVFSSGSKGLRHSFFGDYYEELQVTKDSVRLERFNSGAPVLADHVANLENIIGVVEGASIKDGNGIAKVRFSNDPNSASIVQKIRDGIIRKVSVGYNVYRYDEVAVPEGETPIYRATDWEPMEISFVAIPFDNKAQVRSGLDKVECEFRTRQQEDLKMEEVKSEEVKEEVKEVAPPVESAPVVEEKKEEPPKVEEKKEEPKVEEKSEEARSQEKLRATKILEGVKTAGLEVDFAMDLIQSNKTLETAQTEIHKRWAEKGNKMKIDSRIETKELGGVEHLTRGVTNALLNRAMPEKNELTDEGKIYRGMRLTRLASQFLKAAGYDVDRMSDTEIAKKALSYESVQRAGSHGVSDFPSLLADVANKTLRQAYALAPQTFAPFVRRTTTSDFKNVNRVQLGEAPQLELLSEHDEVKYGSISDGKETFKLATYAKGLKLTRQALINDDTNAFSRLPQQMGRAVASLESDLVYAILNNNPTMGDSVALFHSSHANLGSAGAISDTTLSEMRKLGREQLGLDAVEFLNIFYRYLIVPPALETVAQKAVSAVVPNQTSGVNVFQSLYQVLVEPRLTSDTAWFAAADPGQIDIIELMGLEGQSGPQIESEMEFDDSSMKLKVMYDIAAKAIDYRGLFKNAGA